MSVMDAVCSHCGQSQGCAAWCDKPRPTKDYAPDVFALFDVAGFVAATEDEKEARAAAARVMGHYTRMVDARRLEAAEAALNSAQIELQRYHASELPGGWTAELQGQIDARHAAEAKLSAAEAEIARLRVENARLNGNLY